MTINDDIIKIIKRLRPYACFWEWPNKQLKELHIVKDLLNSMKVQGINEYHSPDFGPSKNDPPDCLVKNILMETIGIELCELVSEVAIRENIKGNKVYCDWTDNGILNKFNSILCEKDNKKYVGGPYRKIAVLIHTDEPSVNYDLCQKLLSTEHFSGYKNISEAYFVLSYDPNFNCCPYIKLHVVN